MDQEDIHKEEKSLWQNHDYLLLWGGQAISSFGSQASRIILPLLILDLTHSPAQAGFIGAFTIIPYVLLSLFVGAVIDRLNRKKVMIVSEIGRALAVGSIFVALYLNHISIIHLYIATFIYGVCFVFFDITEIASLRKIVGNKHIAAATAQNFATAGITALIGPSLGTFLYQIGRGVPFLIDTISYLASVFSLLMIKTNFQEDRVEEKVNIKEDLLEGIRWLLKNKVVRFMALINAGVSFVLADIFLILIVLAKEQHISTVQIGIVASIAAIGSVIGSLVGGRIQKRFSAGKVVIASVWAQAFLWLLYIFTPNFIVIGIITAAITFINSIWAVVQISYRVRLIPDELQGRVNSVFRFSAYSVMPLGMILTGILLQSYGAKVTIIISFFALAAFALTANLSKDLRDS